MKVNHWIIYTLKLEGNCWYVGSTTTRAFKRRMNHHFNGGDQAAKWTLTTAEIARLEDAQTLKMVSLHGTYCVRGGGYCQTVVEPSWSGLLRADRTEKRKQMDGRKTKWRRQEMSAQRQLAASAKRLG